MFSQTSEYALRVVVFLASHLKEPLTTRQIALATHVPEGYLSKVLQNLGRASLVSAQRGLHGGFLLQRDPRQLSVFEVINAVDSIPRITSCPLGLPSHGARLCPLHQRMDDALATVESTFRQSTIGDMLNDTNAPAPLCDVPPKPARPRRGRAPK